MSRRTIAVGGIILAAFVAALWFARERKITPADSRWESPELNAGTNGTSKIGGVPPVNGATSAASPVRVPAPKTKPGVLSLLNDVKIDFYGRVLDQYDAPVVGASVAGIITVNSGFHSDAESIKAITDANGLFRFEGHRGEKLSLTISKGGYMFPVTNTLFIYSHLWRKDERHHPDSKNPVLFRLWKSEGAEELLLIDQRYRYANETSASFDLVAHAKVESGGDLKLSLRRDPGPALKSAPIDWELTIEAIDGGLIPMADVAFQGFFLKSRHGQVYAKIFITFGVNRTEDDGVSVSFFGLANANGSRNLEEDPAKIRTP